MSLRLFDDLDHDNLAGLCIFVCAGGYQDVLADATVFRRHDADAVLLQITADDFHVGSFDDLDNVALAPPACVQSAFAGNHAIAVQDLRHFAGMQEQVLSGIVADEESKAVRMTLHAALDQVELLDHADRILAIAHDLSVALHRAEPTVEMLRLVGSDRQQLRQRIDRYRDALLEQYVENVFATGQWIVVARTFPFDERIAFADFRVARAARACSGGYVSGALGTCGFTGFFRRFHSGNG
jgi:hypothetical protein